MRSVGYDAATSELEIEFAGGDVYRYSMVPASVHQALLDSPSKGAFLGRKIIPRYPAREVYPDRT